MLILQSTLSFGLASAVSWNHDDVIIIIIIISYNLENCIYPYECVPNLPQDITSGYYDHTVTTWVTWLIRQLNRALSEREIIEKNHEFFAYGFSLQLSSWCIWFTDHSLNGVFQHLSANHRHELSCERQSHNPVWQSWGEIVQDSLGTKRGRRPLLINTISNICIKRWILWLWKFLKFRKGLYSDWVEVNLKWRLSQLLELASSWRHGNTLNAWQRMVSPSWTRHRILSRWNVRFRSIGLKPFCTLYKSSQYTI